MQGLVAHERREYERAVDCFRRVIALRPQNAAYHNALGFSLQALGDFDAALVSYREALRLRPDFADAHSNVSSLMLATENFASAAHHAQAALRHEPGHAEAWTNAGTALAHQGQPQQAEACFRSALERKPGLLEARRNLANALAEQGKFAEAQREFEQVVRHAPHDTKSWHGLAVTKRYTAADAKSIGRFEAALTGETEPRRRADLHFALGKILDDCQRYNEAFEHFRAANELIRPVFDRRAETQYVGEIIEAFTPELFRRFSAGASHSEQPVFIVGLPRSGTTLIEQVIAAHPQAHGAGEARELHELADRLPMLLNSSRAYPACISQFDLHVLRDWAESYCERLSGLKPETLRFTVKTPSDVFHLGLAAIVFPHARVIHCQRNPLDTCLSCYCQNFTSPLAYASDLTDLGFYYRLFERLMAHWRRVLPVRMLDVRYEDLVERQADTTRAIISFCGLPWDDRCLKFHEVPRAVQTASAWQVRQPLYATSIGRWRNYERHLGPLRQALAGEPRFPADVTMPARPSQVLQY